MPNLIEVQRESYEQFLRSDPATGYVSGLEKTLRSVFPIRISPAPRTSTSTATSSSIPSTTPTSAASAG
jgi:DNA-directed RNA polymerase beta subunit